MAPSDEDQYPADWLRGFAACLASASRLGLPRYVIVAAMEEHEVTVSMLREVNTPPHDLALIRVAFPPLAVNGGHG